MNINTEPSVGILGWRKRLRSEKPDSLQGQIGNPNGVDDEPNKKFYDPRVWMRAGEESFKKRLTSASEDLNNINTLG